MTLFEFIGAIKLGYLSIYLLCVVEKTKPVLNQAVNDKLQSSVATYSRRGGVVVNNQIKYGLQLSL